MQQDASDSAATLMSVRPSWRGCCCRRLLLSRSCTAHTRPLLALSCAGQEVMPVREHQALLPWVSAVAAHTVVVFGGTVQQLRVPRAGSKSVLPTAPPVPKRPTGVDDDGDSHFQLPEVARGDRRGGSHSGGASVDMGRTPSSMTAASTTPTPTPSSADHASSFQKKVLAVMVRQEQGGACDVV